jgi:hypothetical protein
VQQDEATEEWDRQCCAHGGDGRPSWQQGGMQQRRSLGGLRGGRRAEEPWRPGGHVLGYVIDDGVEPTGADNVGGEGPFGGQISGGRW